jgi:hypothetical protein
MTTEKDAFDLWWEWVIRATDHRTIAPEIHNMDGDDAPNFCLFDQLSPHPRTTGRISADRRRRGRSGQSERWRPLRG